MSSSGPIKLNVKEVLKSKLGTRARFLPAFVVGWLERLIHQEDMNSLLENSYPSEGGEFCEKILRELNAKISLVNEFNLPENGRAVFVCNHPLGGLDGIALIHVLTKRYGEGLKFVVNDILMSIDPLRCVFVPVNKHGGQSRKGALELDDAMKGTAPVVVFPAGLCSRRGENGIVEDLKWRKMFYTKALEHDRPIVPLFFDGLNSDSFYNWANRRKKMGIKFNLEMILLPREVFLARGKQFNIYCGEILGVDKLRVMGPSKGVDFIRQIVYSLKDKENRNE